MSYMSFQIGTLGTVGDEFPVPLQDTDRMAVAGHGILQTGLYLLVREPHGKAAVGDVDVYDVPVPEGRYGALLECSGDT